MNLCFKKATLEYTDTDTGKEYSVTAVGPRRRRLITVREGEHIIDRFFRVNGATDEIMVKKLLGLTLYDACITNQP